MLRIIIDPNLIASVLIGGITRDRFVTLTQRLDILEFIYCDQLIQEIGTFSQKSYFQKKGIDDFTVKSFITFYQEFALKVVVTSQVKVGRDRNDHYLLSLTAPSQSNSAFCRDA